VEIGGNVKFNKGNTANQYLDAGTSANSLFDDVHYIRKQVAQKFKDEAVPMNQIEYSEENFNKEFPEGFVDTPFGKIKLKNNQYEKLEKKDREPLFGGIKPTYNNPTVVINKKDVNGKPSKAFAKSFSELLPENKILMTAVNYKNRGVTAHDRKIDEFLGHINTPNDLLHESKIKGGSETAGDDPYFLNLAGNEANDTQSINNIPQSSPEVNRENIKKENLEAQGSVQGQNIKDINDKLSYLSRLLKPA